MRNDTEDLLISAWINEYNKDHIEDFVPGDFRNGNNPDIVRMLKAGLSGIDVFRKYKSDYLDLQSMFVPMLYDSAYAEAIAGLPHRWATNGMSPQEIVEKAIAINDRLQGVSLAPTIQRNLLGIWTKSKEELRTEGRAHYGIAELDA